MSKTMQLVANKGTTLKNAVRKQITHYTYYNFGFCQLPSDFECVVMISVCEHSIMLP